MNELVLKEFGGVEQAQAYAKSLQASVNSGQVDGEGGLPILKLNKDSGEYTFGEDDIELTEDDFLLADVSPSKLKHGFVAFLPSMSGIADTVDGDPAEFVRPITVPIEEINESLPELEPETYKKDGKRVTETPVWKFTYFIEMYVIEGPNQGARIIYKPTAKMAVPVCRKLLKQVTANILSGRAYIPVFTMGSTSVSTNYGDKWKPVFDNIEFVLPGEIVIESDVEEETAKVKKPATKSKTKKPATKSKAKKPQPVEEEEFEDEEEFEEDEILELEEDEYEEIEEDEIEEDEIEEDEVEEKPKASTRKKRATKPVAGAVKKTAPKAAQETAQKRTRKKRGQA